ncbi:hypothetical protein [Actibacterium sp. 188UL27-1]|uniref:hypothetical protein n=1 Tax=Actibacterium sp. 188UL27-1 TaxID=2786961 RepID=UPI00195D10F8|nr:hypothetical protein [Actibacterium sp. 188UL27-1]MBM7069331.1 hypothetical protein [Actibacterium sp. 188UL27-1]
MTGRDVNANTVLGLVVIALALIVLLVWIPLDTESGILEQVRRKVTIGDAMEPSLAAILMLVSGILLLVEPGGPALSPAHLRWLAGICGILVLGFALIRWTGPVMAWLWVDGVEYRLLRDTAPWKHLGLITGSIAIVAGLIAVVERRLSVRGILVALTVAGGLILIYDLPFDDLLLPPNGDV